MRWLQGVDVKRQRVERFVGQARLSPMRIFRQHVIGTEVGRFAELTSAA